ncbi:hypothetical protein Ga0080574_TMP775 [Salipiger abyssi]|uniref:Uncharacterized protein n=1 Tax=Salipiger abyssi TaxID=1250539 RepID=A0A1P8UNW6_9RHOB|nr:hypothetical protein Ga0080574_TMP775 [Salipiger abyssi]
MDPLQRRQATIHAPHAGGAGHTPDGESDGRWFGHDGLLHSSWLPLMWGLQSLEGQACG